MSFNRIRISKLASFHLAALKGRTGLTPNILSRIAICVSFAEPGLPRPPEDEDGQEFNRYTLTGEWDLLFMALLKERLIDDGLDPDKDLLIQFKGHLNRGVTLLLSRIKSVSDIQDLIPAEGLTS